MHVANMCIIVQTRMNTIYNWSHFLSWMIFQGPSLFKMGSVWKCHVRSNGRDAAGNGLLHPAEFIDLVVRPAMNKHQ